MKIPDILDCVVVDSLPRDLQMKIYNLSEADLDSVFLNADASIYPNPRSEHMAELILAMFELGRSAAVYSVGEEYHIYAMDVGAGYVALYLADGLNHLIKRIRQESNVSLD